MGKQLATFAGGCFWCTEAIFKRLKGVFAVTPGYSGGKVEKPSYQAVSSGESGHTETIQIAFDPTIISFDKLLAVFFATHDPTTLNQQGADIGTQYRSAIFYHSEEQKRASEKAIKKYQVNFKDPIVTEILPFEVFYKAEDYHSDYYDKNRSAPYCRVVIDPKIQKLYKEFKNEVKSKN